MRVFLVFGVVGTLAVAGVNEELRARLLSGDPAKEAEALRILGTGVGDPSFIPAIVSVHLRRGREFMESGDEQAIKLTAVALTAMESLLSRYPTEVTRALIEMSVHWGASDLWTAELFWRSPRALEELIRAMKNPDVDSRTVAGALLLLQVAPTERVQNASEGFFSLLNIFLVRALRTENPELIVKVGGLLEAFSSEDVEPKKFNVLLPDLLQILRSDRWLPKAGAHFEAESDPHYAIALPTFLIGGSSPDLIRRYQAIYIAQRKAGLNAEQNQFWLNLINISQGKPAHDVEAAAVARERLDRLITNESKGLTIKMRDWIKAEATQTIAALESLDPEEAHAYLKKLMDVSRRSSRNLRAEVTRQLVRSPNPELVDLALANPKCVKILKLFKRR